MADITDTTLNMDMDLTTEMGLSDNGFVDTLTSTMFSFDSQLPENCANEELSLDIDNITLPDLCNLEDFMDLTEFFVSQSFGHLT